MCTHQDLEGCTKSRYEQKFNTDGRMAAEDLSTIIDMNLEGDHGAKENWSLPDDAFADILIALSTEHASRSQSDLEPYRCNLLKSLRERTSAKNRHTGVAVAYGWCARSIQVRQADLKTGLERISYHHIYMEGFQLD